MSAAKYYSKFSVEGQIVPPYLIQRMNVICGARKRLHFSFTSNFRSVFIHERRCGPDDSIRCWTFDRAGRVIVAPRAALPDNYRIIPLVLGCVSLCRIFS